MSIEASPSRTKGYQTLTRRQPALAVWTVLFLIAVLLTQAGCSRDRESQSYSPRVIGFGEPVPRGGGHYKLGRPYVVAGVRYVPQHQPHYDETGIASWYGRDFHGRLTANGEVYDMDAISAAHPTLPLPSMVRVTNLENGRTMVVRINDRGPFKPGRIIDLSRRAAHDLGMLEMGLARVRVQYVGAASL
jgi:rare lipoprotein A